MNNLYNIDWDYKKHRFHQWWHQENSDGPLLIIQAPLSSHAKDFENDKWVGSSSGNYSVTKQEYINETTDFTDYWTNFDQIIARNEKAFQNQYYIGDTYPRMFANLGVASLAVFLGCNPIFAKDTIWYQHIFDDPECCTISLPENNPWLDWSLKTTQKSLQYAQGRFKVGIPDLCEHLDVLASLFDTQNLLINMFDCEDDIIRLSKEVQECWFKVYDMHYKLVKEADGFCNYGPFQLLGAGRTAKLQCDMSAMIGRDMFDTFVLPFLQEQTEWLDNSLYHLDGPDALKHLDSILSLKELSALQWTPGAGNCDGGDEQWDFIYEKALNAGKSVYALVSAKNIRRFKNKFGSRGILMMTSAANKAEADEIINIVTNS